MVNITQIFPKIILVNIKILNNNEISIIKNSLCEWTNVDFNLMKKFALISLRNDLIIDRNERRDSIDIEIYNLVLELGYIPILLPNEPIIIDYFEIIFKEKNIGLVLFSGGNDILKFKDNKNSNSYFKRDSTELKLINYCIAKTIPILSICRGFQLIASYLGGNIENRRSK